MTFSFFPPHSQSNAQSNSQSNSRPSPTFATTPTAGQAAPLPLMALAPGAALFLATPAQTPVAAGATPDLESGPGSAAGSALGSGSVSGPDLSLSAATAGRAAPGDSQMRLELIAAAEAGDAGAQYRLAVDHFLGTHPRANDGRALYWYRRAAEQGHVPAQLLLGQMYESGWGVASDRAQPIAGTARPPPAATALPPASFGFSAPARPRPSARCSRSSGARPAPHAPKPHPRAPRAC